MSETGDSSQPFDRKWLEHAQASMDKSLKAAKRHLDNAMMHCYVLLKNKHGLTAAYYEELECFESSYFEVVASMEGIDDTDVTLLEKK